MKKQLIKELDRELSMRKRVYRTADAKNDRFINSSEQHQYDTMKKIRNMIAAMTDPEIQRMITRADEILNSQGEQKQLF